MSKRWKHGMDGTRPYKIWINMRFRCNNSNAANYPRYGGRGIKVCPSWNASFEAFWADMGATYAAGLSIDRLDGELGYSPENCRWSTPVEQCRNRSGSMLVDDPKLGLVSVSEVARARGLKPKTVHERIRRNIPREQWFAPVTK